MYSLEEKPQLVHHILIIRVEKFKKIVFLENPIYSIGRQNNCSITLPFPYISRHHATLLRKTDASTHNHSYWIFDGDLQEKRSQNGTFVNQNSCISRQLDDGDIIYLGHSVRAEYYQTSGQELRSQLKPLGTILRRADLITASQLEIALRDQSEQRGLRIGEILALRGWIKQQTADFFAEQWPSLLLQKQKRLLGQYFRAAALLDEAQIDAILFEQKHARLRFGEMAIRKGWLKPTTVNFFLLTNKSSSQTSTTHIIERVLKTKQISSQEQDWFLSAMSGETPLSKTEQAGVREIFDRLAKRELRLVD